MYQNTQFGTLTVVSLLAGIVLCLWVGTAQAWNPIVVGVLGFLVVALALFHSLSVEVDSAAVRCRFGIGLISKTIPIDQVQDAVHVKNRWYYGWGIRRVPGAWMFNVSGLDAVELHLSSGKRFRIGTNDPEGLISAIDQARATAG